MLSPLFKNLVSFYCMVLKIICVSTRPYAGTPTYIYIPIMIGYTFWVQSKNLQFWKKKKKRFLDREIFSRKKMIVQRSNYVVTCLAFQSCFFGKNEITHNWDNHSKPHTRVLCVWGSLITSLGLSCFSGHVTYNARALSSVVSLYFSEDNDDEELRK